MDWRFGERYPDGPADHLPALVAALLRPEAYPDPAPDIELVQTHISYVFLAGDYVYKVKKPVSFGFLDFSTLQRRHHFCQREVELNQRLSPDVYLSVVPIIDDDGRIAIGGRGNVIEYAVKMRRLPEDRMLDRMIERGAATPQMLERVAQVVAAFHAQATTSIQISAYGDVPAIIQNTEQNFEQTQPYVGRCLSPRQYAAIVAYTRRFIAEHDELFAERRHQRRIRDCHGDLRAEHICITNGIYLFDCIEFNERFRWGDVAAEVAFLAMDLDGYGRLDLSDAFVAAYIRLSEDAELRRLLPFYKCYRAYVRAKVDSLLLNDPTLGDDERRAVAERARCHFDLAFGGALSPALVVVCGVTGTGKTTVAEALGRRLGFAVVSSDVVRKTLAGIPLAEHRFVPLGAGIYNAEFTQRTYDELLRRARELLDSGRSAILDATYRRRADRVAAGGVAHDTGANLFVIECTLDKAVARRRLDARLREDGVVSDGRWEIYLEQVHDFEPVTEMPSNRLLRLDTAAPREHVVEAALEWLAA